MTTRIQLRRGNASSWTTANPVLALGEAGIETDTLTWKVGDGTTAWANLAYMSGNGGGGNTFSSITLTSTPINAANTIQYGLGNLIGYLDGQWTIGEYNGTDYGTQGIRICPGIEGATDIYLPADQNANVDALTVSNYAGNVQIQTGNGYQWKFDSNGQINIPEGSNSFDDGRIQSANGYPTLLGYGSSEHGGPELDWMDSDDPANAFGNSTVIRNTMYINDGGLYVGMNENEVANVAIASWRFDPQGATYFPTLNVARGDNPSGTITGQTLLFGDATQEAIISTPDGYSGNEYSQRLVINPGAGYDYGEGGDIYLWAGRGGDNNGSGGDVKIRGGQGMGNTGSGGYLRIEAGDSPIDGQAGYIDITGGGSGNTTGGYVNVTGGYGATVGGDVKIYGGYGQATGGNVNIWGGASGNGQANEGHVNIQTGGNTWTFDAVGNLTLPNNTFAVNYANGSPVNISGGGGNANTGNVTFDNINIIGTGNLKLQPDDANSSAYLDIYLTVGPDIHIAGNGETVIVGADNNANIAVNANGDVTVQTWNGSANTWTFGNAGTFITPGVSGNITGANVIEANLFTSQSGAGNVVLASNSNNWTFGTDGEFYLPTGGRIGATKGGTMLDGGNANSVSLTSYYGNGYYAGCFTANPDGNVYISTYTGNGLQGQWLFDNTGNLTSNGVISANVFTNTFDNDVSIVARTGQNGNIYIHPDGSGQIIMGGAASTLLFLQSDTPNTQNKITVYTYGNGLGSFGGGTFVGQYNRLDSASLSGDRFAAFTGSGSEDGANVTQYSSGKITIDAAGNWSVGNTPTHISFWTTAFNSNTSSETIRFDASGNLNMIGGGNIVGVNTVITTPIAYANLTAVAGGRAFVNNGNLAAAGNFGAQVSGGGSNTVPVWSDGANWYIG
jgi:hypothetical protein